MSGYTNFAAVGRVLLKERVSGSADTVKEVVVLTAW
jgi:hypothetical protein